MSVSGPVARAERAEEALRKLGAEGHRALRAAAAERTQIVETLDAVTADRDRLREERDVLRAELAKWANR